MPDTEAQEFVKQQRSRDRFNNGKADIIDVRPFQYERVPLQESGGQGGDYVIRGILQRADAKNQNGRVYPKHILEREVERYKKEFINKNMAYGELDHPDSSQVELKNASHIVRDVWWKGNDVLGEVKVLPTPMGNILRTLLDENLSIGISSRGMGSVDQKRDGTVKVNEDFQLIAWDFVSNPSTHGAFMGDQNLRESVSKQDKTNLKWRPVENFAQDILREMNEVQ
jgi:hypothetical protein